MPLKKKYYRKLIRDKIPEIITAEGDTYKVRKLEEAEFKTALFKKLSEETKELQTAKPQHIAEELSDILEVLEAIASLHHISWTDVRHIQKTKHQQRGSFAKRLFLMWSTKKK